MDDLRRARLRARSWWRLRSLHPAALHPGRPLAVLIAVGVVVMIAAWSLGRWETGRRSAETAVAIRATRFQPGGGLELERRGTWIDYSYTVDGVIYPARDFREWSDVDRHRPKVCYAPSDPADHLLVDFRVRCGRDAGPDPPR